MNDENTLNLMDYVGIVIKRKKLIILITLLAVIVAAVISFFVMKPVYEAQTSIIVGKPQASANSAANASSNYTDVMMYQSLIKTYVEIAQSKLVAQKALDGLNSDMTLNQLQKSITVTPQTGTQILIIKAQSGDPKDAMDIINAVSDAFIYQSKSVFPTGGDIQIMDKADMPKAPVKPNKKLYIAIAFFLGLMVSVGIAFLLETLDNTIKTESDVEKYLGLPIIGMIPKSQDNRS